MIVFTKLAVCVNHNYTYNVLQASNIIMRVLSWSLPKSHILHDGCLKVIGGGKEGAFLENLHSEHIIIIINVIVQCKEYTVEPQDIRLFSRGRPDILLNMPQSTHLILINSSLHFGHMHTITWSPSRKWINLQGALNAGSIVLWSCVYINTVPCSARVTQLLYTTYY